MNINLKRNNDIIELDLKDNGNHSIFLFHINSITTELHINTELVTIYSNGIKLLELNTKNNEMMDLYNTLLKILDIE